MLLYLEINLEIPETFEIKLQLHWTMQMAV